MGASHCSHTSQAVVNAEAKPFRDARTELPALRAATRWAAIESSWGYARALASELCWLRDAGAVSAPTIATAAAGSGTVSAGASSCTISSAALAPPGAGEGVEGGSAGVMGPEGKATAGKMSSRDEPTVYCICRTGDYGGVMVSCDACSEWFHAPW